MSIDAAFPEKLQILFQPNRYKVLWGGRGAGRSWNVARALLLIGMQRPIRVLCAREFQNSIAESVHKVLSDQIEKFDLAGFYEVQKQGIYGANGTSFSFEGIKNNTTRIKSYEGVDYCWVEEAVKVSRTSWNILIPTIRKDGSEIWMTFNPELESDYTYEHFVKKATRDMVVVHMTWRDNPWFPPVLMKELLEARESDPDMYLNVWEGKCLRALEGAVYAKELRETEGEGRICTVPWERQWPVSVWMDLGAGRSDRTAIWFAQRVALQNRILGYYENNLSDTLHYAKEIQSRPYTIDTIWLPHDAKAKRIGLKMTIEEQFRQHFPNSKVRIVPKLSIADGINAARLTFPNCYFDEEECEGGLKALRHYQYEVTERNSVKEFSRDPKHDWASHGADAFRYLALTIRGTGAQARHVGVLERLEAAAQAFKNPPGAEQDGDGFSGRRGASGLSQGWMNG